MGLEDIAKGAKWPAWTIQLSLLAINTAFILQKKSNSCILVSLMFVLSLFVLQTMSKRFLFLYPVYGNIPTPEADTFILRAFILLASLFLFLGALKVLPYDVKSGDEWLISLLPILAIVFIGFLPLFFWVIGVNAIRNKIAESLKDKLPDYNIKCPCCDQLGAKLSKKIISPDEFEVTLQICDNCRIANPKKNHQYKWREPANIG